MSFNPRALTSPDEKIRHTVQVLFRFNPRALTSPDTYGQTVAQQAYVSIHGLLRALTSPQSDGIQGA